MRGHKWAQLGVALKERRLPSYLSAARGSKQMPPSEGPARAALEVLLECFGLRSLWKCGVKDQIPWHEFAGVVGFAGVVLGKSSTQILR